MKRSTIILLMISTLVARGESVSAGLQAQMGTAMMGMMAASQMHRKNAGKEKDYGKKSAHEGQADAFLLTAISLALVGGFTATVLGSQAIDASVARAGYRRDVELSRVQTGSQERIAKIQSRTTLESKAIDAATALALDKEKQFHQLRANLNAR